MFDEFDDDAVERGHGLFEVEVVVVIAVDAVRDGFKSEEWRIVAQTDLGDGTAFHFDEEGVEVVAHGIGSRATLGKPIARGAEPAQIWDGDFVECAFGAIEVRDGEMDAIDRADISQGIAASGRVDVVLNEFIGEHNRADGGVYEAACDADIDDEIGGISIDAELCCHGGVDFANATGTGDEVFAETIEMVCPDVCHYQPENGVAFDAIVSNPPYHTEELLPPCAARAAARHTAALSFAALFVHARRLLRQGGTFALIVPAAALKEVKGEAMLGGFSLMRRTSVVTRPGKPPKRELLQFVLDAAPQVAVCDTLPLMPADGSYARSEAYAALTKDFYL